MRTNKMKRIYILLLATMLLLLSACNDFTSPDRFDGDTYSISGLIVADNPIDMQRPIYVCRSSSVDDFSLLDLFVSDAEVKIYEFSGADTTKIITLEPVLDLGIGSDFPLPRVKYIDPEAYLIKGNHTYRIEVRIPGYAKTIWAQTTVPPQATLNMDYFGHNDPIYGYSPNPENMKKMRMGQVDTAYPLALNMGTFSGPQNFFSEFYCMEEFSTDLEFTTPVFGTTNPTENMRDGYYSSGESIRRIQFMGKYAAQAQNDSADNYVIVRDYKQAFVFYGRYRVTAMVVDDNYYRYSFMPEGYLYGGVRNGLGYFGSASGGTMYTEIVKD